jgi:hypothetical protein
MIPIQFNIYSGYNEYPIILQGNLNNFLGTFKADKIINERQERRLQSYC